MSFSGQGGYFQGGDASDDDTRFSATLVPPQPRRAPPPRPSPKQPAARDSGLVFGAVRFPSTTSVLWDRAAAAPFRAALSDDAPAVVITAGCARALDELVDEASNAGKPLTKLFIGAVAARSKVARSVDAAKCPPAATAARRAVVFGDDVAVQAVGGRRLDILVRAGGVITPSSDEDDLALSASVTKGDSLHVALTCAAPSTLYAFAQLRTPLAVLPTPLDCALRRSNGASLPRRPGAYDAAVRIGYITLDEARRAVFLLDDDPLVEAAPLVGVFCAGFVCADASRACRDGAVVAACAAFFRRAKRDPHKAALVDADTCLVGVFAAPARNMPASCTFFECAGAPDSNRDVLDFACDLDATSYRPRGVEPRALVVASLKRRPCLAPPPAPVPQYVAPPSPARDDDSATTTTMDESTMDTRYRRATGRIRELEAKLAAYEGAAQAAAPVAPAAKAVHEDAAVPATAAAPAAAPAKSVHEDAAVPAKAPAAPAEKAAAPPSQQTAPPADLPPAVRPCRAAQGLRRAAAGQAPRPPASPAAAPAPQPAASPAQPPPPPAVFPARRPKGELHASTEDVADAIGGAYDTGTDEDEDVSFASVGVVRALRLPDVSVGSLGPETPGGALEAAAYAATPLTEVDGNFDGRGVPAAEKTDLNAFPKIRAPPADCFFDPDSDDEIVAQYVETGVVDA